MSVVAQRSVSQSKSTVSGDVPLTNNDTGDPAPAAVSARPIPLAAAKIAAPSCFHRERLVDARLRSAAGGVSGVGEVPPPRRGSSAAASTCTVPGNGCRRGGASRIARGPACRSPATRALPPLRRRRPRVRSPGPVDSQMVSASPRLTAATASARARSTTGWSGVGGQEVVGDRAIIFLVGDEPGSGRDQCGERCGAPIVGIDIDSALLRQVCEAENVGALGGMTGAAEGPPDFGGKVLTQECRSRAIVVDVVIVAFAAAVP